MQVIGIVGRIPAEVICESGFDPQISISAPSLQTVLNAYNIKSYAYRVETLSCLKTAILRVYADWRSSTWPSPAVIYEVDFGSEYLVEISGAFLSGDAITFNLYGYLSDGTRVVLASTANTPVVNSMKMKEIWMHVVVSKIQLEVGDGSGYHWFEADLSITPIAEIPQS